VSAFSKKNEGHLGEMGCFKGGGEQEARGATSWIVRKKPEGDNSEHARDCGPIHGSKVVEGSLRMVSCGGARGVTM